MAAAAEWTLVDRARRGDHSAFTELMTRHQVALYNLALRMVGQPDDAADITQEAFLRAWEKLSSLRSAPFRPWLFRIGVNLCYDLHRQRRHFAAGADAEHAGNVIGLSPSPDPARAAESAERSRLVREAILGLEPELRSAIALRDINGLAYEEVAAVLEVPLGTVKSRISRARAHVQERLLLYPELFHLDEEDLASHGS